MQITWVLLFFLPKSMNKLLSKDMKTNSNGNLFYLSPEQYYPKSQLKVIKNQKCLWICHSQGLPEEVYQLRLMQGPVWDSETENRMLGN